MSISLLRSLYPQLFFHTIEAFLRKQCKKKKSCEKIPATSGKFGSVFYNLKKSCERRNVKNRAKKTLMNKTKTN